MKIKKILLLLYLTISNMYYSQSESQLDKLTNIVPPSPQAFNIIQYGNQPLNEYKGMAQVNIPITKIKNKDLFNDIELKYSKLGVKVNEVSSNVGVSWILDVGGVITRTIFDLPDEQQPSSNRLIFNNISEFAYLSNSQNGSDNAALVNSYIKNESIDNEIDIFNISVNGLTGSFYLNKDFNPILLNDTHQFKIEAIGDFKISHELLLTSIDGIKYYFGGINATEITWNRESTQYSGITSFYLTKIENVLGQQINFEYTNVGGKAFNISRLEQRVIENKVINDYCIPNRQLGQASYINKNNILRVTNAKILSRILSDEISIKFNYQNINNAIYEKLISIEIFSKHEKYQTINFEYLDKYSGDQVERFFLTGIKKYTHKDGVKIFDSEHLFEYNDPLSIPFRNSYSVDVYGYYNGKFNTTLIPDLNLLSQAPVYNLQGLNLADRRSVFNYAVKGTLKSITYPTKGKTFFEYEALPKKTITYFNKSGTVSTNEMPAVNVHSSIINGADVFDNLINMKLSIYQEISSAIPNNMGIANFKIFNAETNEVLVNKDLILPKATPDNEGPSSKEIIFDFPTVPNKQYKLVMTLLRPNIQYNADYIATYKTGYEKVNEVGLRLKKVFDFDGNNNINIKRLYYSTFDNIKNVDILPENLYYPAIYLSSNYDITGCLNQNPNPSPSLSPIANQQRILSSESINDYFDGESRLSNSYPIVTISYGGDNFEKGGEEKRFSHGNYDESVILNTIIENNDYYGSDLSSLVGTIVNSFSRNLSFDDFNGKLLENIYFSNNNNGQLYLKKKISFDYNLVQSKTVFNLIGRDIYSLFGFASGTNSSNIISNLFLMYYPRKSYSLLLNKKFSTEYFENVPYNTLNDSVYKKLTKISNYYYNNPLHSLLTKQTTTFPDGSITETTYQYAHEKNNTRLINANMIGIPLETSVVEKENPTDAGTLISKSETKYDDASHLFPSSAVAYNLASGNASTQATFNKYDSKGNILQYTTKEGIPTSIIWGYNGTQPIAKIEGAVYDNIKNNPLITAIITASDSDAVNPATESSLVIALDALRNDVNFKDFQMATFTYDPLIGVTTLTPPSGIREIYKYDSANRLEKIVDEEGKILKEYQYNYKP